MTIRSPAHAAFGQEIRAIRDRRGVSQESLALRCGLDRTYISGIERGTRNPSLTNILKLAAALDVGPAELFAGVHGGSDGPVDGSP
ncbi:MAG TPA: helix-turn-helix transcriptional regulator [Solirubrobacteraceae bacterium]|jgi:transcriptional regulator with XRE-family HTH domain|nr:helix-turn-helix transcriptional regulator [Solirubrobacteraceae bacterium]